MKPKKLYFKIFFSFLGVLIITEVVIFVIFLVFPGKHFKARIEHFTAAKVMIEQGRGNIINISSRSGQQGTQNLGPYSAAKAGMNNLTETLAWELAPYNIRVNCLCLGPVLTEINHDLFMEDPERGMSGLLIKRFGLPEDVGAFCVFLASEASSWITGKVYEIDGGLRSTFQQA